MTHTAKLDACKRARHAEVARRYAWHARRMAERRGEPDRARLIANIRLRELERLYERRYRGRALPDDDDGRDSLELVAHHIAHLRGEVEHHIVAWASLWCPWLPQAEASALAARVAANPRRFKASTLAWRLRLTEVERAELEVTTIRSIGCITDQDVAERRRRRDRERKAGRRALARRARPEPLSRAKPWENEGVSRATWYRRRRETKPVRSRVEPFAADGICLTHGARGEAAKISMKGTDHQHLQEHERPARGEAAVAV